MLKHSRIIDENEVNAKPLLKITLWPNRSLNKKMFVSLLFMTLGGMLVPIIPFIGTKIVIVLLPFSITTLIILILSILANNKAGKIYEELTIWPKLIEVKRYEVNGSNRKWNANPYWTKVKLYKESQKVQNYLTLTGSGREIEIGAFLAPNERLEIKQKIDDVLKQMY